jgi:signal transduction histidine kinase
MGRLIRNAEFQDIAVKMLLILLAASVLLCVLCIVQTNTIHRKLVDQSAAILGKAIAVHPEIEKDIVGALLKQAGIADIERGRAVLAKYGYDASAPVSVDPILGGMTQEALLFALGFMLVFAAALYLVTAKGYVHIYGKVRVISGAAEKVVDGNFTVQLPAGEEGEFDILGHRFNQMANRLRLNVEQLMAEKVFLKSIISDISHQLKTPLSSLIVYNDLMAADENMDAVQRGNFIGLERQQLQRLEWLIQSLLKMARLEAGSIEFRREKVLLGDVAQSAAAALGTLAADAGVSVSIRELHSGTVFTGDEAWLTEAVINILKNGIEHSKPGGAIEIRLEQTPLTSTIAIDDHGEGIDSADLPHIFERFYRGSNNVKPNSIGIGLALAKAIVEGQGGSISVRSEKGRGSEFTVTFLRTMGE